MARHATTEDGNADESFPKKILSLEPYNIPDLCSRDVYDIHLGYVQLRKCCKAALRKQNFTYISDILTALASYAFRLQMHDFDHNVVSELGDEERLYHNSISKAYKSEGQEPSHVNYWIQPLEDLADPDPMRFEALVATMLARQGKLLELQKLEPGSGQSSTVGCDIQRSAFQYKSRHSLLKLRLSGR